MKRTRLLAFSLVFALMLMGVGYAYWSDTLTVEGTVDTGTLDVNYTETMAVTYLEDFSDGTFGSNNEAYDGTGVTAVATGSIVPTSEVDDSVDVALGNLYPGCEGTIHFQVINDGTIPVKFAYGEVDITDASGLADYIQLNGYINFDDGDEYFIGNWDGHPAGNYFEDTLSMLESRMNHNGSLEGDILEPGDVMDVFIDFRVDPELTDLQDTDLSFTLDMTWEQFNFNSSDHEGVV